MTNRYLEKVAELKEELSAKSKTASKPRRVSHPEAAINALAHGTLGGLVGTGVGAVAAYKTRKAPFTVGRLIQRTANGAKAGMTAGAAIGVGGSLYNSYRKRKDD